MQHIKEQNWFAVGLDVIVVIVGIFLGMQVTEWNEERKDKESLTEALINYQQEVQLVINYQNEISIYNEPYEVYTKEFVEYVVAEDRNENDTFNYDFALRYLNQSQFVADNLESLRQLYDSGLIHRIDDYELKKLITQFTDRLNKASDRFDRIQDNLYQNRISYREFPFISLTYQLNDMISYRILIDKEQALASKEFKNRLIELWQRKRFDMASSNSIKRDALTLCYQLSKYTGNSCNEDATNRTEEELEQYILLVERMKNGLQVIPISEEE
jgi:hypothetical protein